MNAYRTIAIRAANLAGDFIVKAFNDRDRVIARKKDLNDYVTNVDQQSEYLIINTIKTAYPEHSILAEESGLQEGSDKDTVWVIDPLDGTRNFIDGNPHFSISIAVKQKGKTVAAVIFDPMRDEMFSASNGNGAQLNQNRIRVAGEKKLEKSILATGFPFRSGANVEEYLSYFSTLLPLCSDMRRAGSAALDLAYLASGRVNAFWEFGLSDWDTAAGVLIVKEAGGLVGDVKGNPFSTNSKSIMAANPHVFKQFMQTVKEL